MSGFAPDWLALRAEADLRARDPGLARSLARAMAGRGTVRVLDIGAGTGANLRATVHLLAGQQHWVLADHDPALLARVEAPEGVRFETRAVDLATGLAGLFDPAPDLVTASAFFDLCGADWLAEFCARLAASGAAFYAVLTYDGRETWAPPHPLDARVRAAFHADQRRDKGLGPALGPDAPDALARALREAGLVVREAASDWDLSAPRDAPLIGALAEGSAQAVSGAVGHETAREWMLARSGADRVTIGHTDVLALPAGRG